MAEEGSRLVNPREVVMISIIACRLFTSQRKRAKDTQQQTGKDW